MKGMMRSIHYWLYNTEKIFVVMIATIIGVLALQAFMYEGDPEMLERMMETYMPMLGLVYVLSMSISSATYYIPQSLSNGGTRKEVYTGMQISYHAVLLQILVLIVAAIRLTRGEILPAPYIRMCVVLYLLILGIGNILCVCCLKFGGKTGMVIYMVSVMVVSAMIGALAGFSSMDVIEAWLIKAGSYVGLAAAIVVDIVTMIVCYLPLRKYEVRI